MKFSNLYANTHTHTHQKVENAYPFEVRVNVSECNDLKLLMRIF